MLMTSRYLTRTKFLQPRDVAYSLSMLSVAYLSMPQMNKLGTDEELEASLKDGIYAFYDYASACWAIHLQESIDSLGSEEPEQLDKLQETLESFLEVHWSSSAKQLTVTPKMENLLSIWRTSEAFDKICQSLAWSRKQHGNNSESPYEGEATDIWEVTRRVRGTLENLKGLDDNELESLEEFYGQNWYKCPRVHCYYYHQGFRSAEERKRHVDRHERPYLCYINGCHMAIFGCTTKDELTNHLFNYHGINDFDDQDFPSEQQIQKQKTLKPSTTSSQFQCPQCPKTFKTKHSLLTHSRAHEGIKQFACDECNKRFMYKSDLNRHVRGHGDKKFKCQGPLRNGSMWGCGRLFARADKWEDHLRSKSGQKCIRPWVLESLAERSGTDAVDGIELTLEADKLLAAGQHLPSFDKFLQICGLNKSELLRETGASSATTPEVTSESQ